MFLGRAIGLSATVATASGGRQAPVRSIVCLLSFTICHLVVVSFEFFLRFFLSFFLRLFSVQVFDSLCIVCCLNGFYLLIFNWIEWVARFVVVVATSVFVGMSDLLLSDVVRACGQMSVC